MHHNTLGYASQHKTTAKVNLDRYGISLSYSLNQHLGQSQASEDLSHICSHTEHPNAKTHAHFSCSASQMAGTPQRLKLWRSFLNAQCLPRWLSVSQAAPSLRSMWLETWMMCSRSGSTGFPPKSHYTHKWTAWVQSTDRVSDSALTAVRASFCQGNE